MIELVSSYTADSHATLRIISVNTTKNAMALAEAIISVNLSVLLVISILFI